MIRQKTRVELDPGPDISPRGQEQTNPGSRAGALSFEKICKTFIRRGDAPVQVLEDLSLQIAAGSFVCIVGPSGCGKTTLLRIANGITKADSGTVALDGRADFRPGRDVAMVHQNYGLFPWQTVGQNVGFGLRMQGDPGAAKAMGPQLARVGLERFRDFYPHEISGGMQQRVGIARALAVRPRVLLMDEPFAAVDALTREELQQLLLDIWSAERLTVVFITHDIAEAVYLADRVVVMGRGKRIIDDIDIELPRPRSLETRTSSEFVAAERRIRGGLQ